MSVLDDDFIWSNTDYPYACLVDRKRTLAFKQAIEQVVKAGDVVVDVGSGSGVLAMFAARAGASKVYSIEIEHSLAEALRLTFKKNGLEEVIEVIEGNAMEVYIPKNVDVVIAELIETGLIDEMQVAVMNNFHEREIIGERTVVIPRAYDTYMQLLTIQNSFYGFNFQLPFHDWPYYKDSPEDWERPKWEVASERVKLGHYDFNNGSVDPLVTASISAHCNPDKAPNGILLSGTVYLTDEIQLGPCNTLNGDKVFPLDVAISPEGEVNVRIQYTMSRGLGELHFSDNAVG